MRKGGPPSHISCEEFTSFSDTCELIYVDTVGTEFTWSIGRNGRRHTDIRLNKAHYNAACYAT